MGLFYDLSAKDIKGEEKSMSEFRNKVCLITNTACKCGYTHGSYTKLEELSQKYHDKGLEVLCFPSNQFAKQEPWPEPQIESFVRDNWPKLYERIHLFSKIDINGDDTHPVYAWLKESFPGDIRWNFATKVLFFCCWSILTVLHISTGCFVIVLMFEITSFWSEVTENQSNDLIKNKVGKRLRKTSVILLISKFSVLSHFKELIKKFLSIKKKLVTQLSCSNCWFDELILKTKRLRYR
ncbi:Glutathione peroxidase family protein [Reticulomyxa filosa]|uniref:Glutathione peroxidase n=1 Tax=Reticulomyxa filosa TaxID=46433 RepID=X6MX08_RETFI|nr:Glutathione peroxidase family protein [Reticulomyxa filosa]|eukprot:ETO18543.1 Glutathione peroxidase family protein [Reticulomyxa filosa]